MTTFPSESFFTLSEVSFADLFEGLEHAWEALPLLQPYIQEQFTSGKLVSNYGDSGFISIGEGTIIEEGAKIVGPAIIGKNCVIGHGALIRGGCLFGNGVMIGHATEVKSSILLHTVSAAHLNYIGDSIVGNAVSIAGGAIFANLRFDHKSVTIKSGSERVDTGLQKFGSLVGDASRIGANAVLNPGTVLGRGSIVYPLTSVVGVHEGNVV